MFLTSIQNGPMKVKYLDINITFMYDIIPTLTLNISTKIWIFLIRKGPALDSSLLPDYLEIDIGLWSKDDHIMIRVFARLLLVDLERLEGGGRVVEAVQVGEDDGEGGALPRVHLHALLKGAV